MAFRKAISSWKVLQQRLVLIFIKPYRSQLIHRIKWREGGSEIEVPLYLDGGRHLMRTLHTFLFLYLSYLLVVSVFFYLDYSLFFVKPIRIISWILDMREKQCNGHSTYIKDQSQIRSLFRKWMGLRHIISGAFTEWWWSRRRAINVLGPWTSGIFSRRAFNERRAYKSAQRALHYR